MFTDYILIKNIWSLYHWCSDHKSNVDHQPHIWTCMTTYLVTLLPLSQFHLLNPLAKHSIDGHSRPGMRTALPTAAAPDLSPCLRPDPPLPLSQGPRHGHLQAADQPLSPNWDQNGRLSWDWCRGENWRGNRFARTFGRYIYINFAITSVLN